MKKIKKINPINPLIEMSGGDYFGGQDMIDDYVNSPYYLMNVLFGRDLTPLNPNELNNGDNKRTPFKLKRK